MPTRQEIIRSKCIADTLFATRYFFYAENARRFNVGEHHKRIAAALDRVFSGQCTRLIINCPPRYSKTEMLKAFVKKGLAINPASKYIMLSYSANLALDNSERIKDALAAVNMEFLAETPIDQSGVAKAYDANELNNFVNSVAEDLVRNIDLVYYFICEYRYRTIVPNDKARQAMLPAVNVPTKFDIANTTILMQELQGARQAEANPETLRVLETNYAKMQFNTSPEVATRLEIVFDLDPLFGVKEENKMTMLQNGGITETAYIISCNIHAFVRRAIFEDKEFCQKDYDKKMQVLEKYAEEVHTAAEQKATEKAQQQADFGGLDQQPADGEKVPQNEQNKADKENSENNDQDNA